jgi:hypothetical protein
MTFEPAEYTSASARTAPTVGLRGKRVPEDLSGNGRNFRSTAHLRRCAPFDGEIDIAAATALCAS